VTATEEGDHAPIVRPYTRTGGRTRSSVNLPLEALIVTTAAGKSSDDYVQPEHRDIANLCRDVRSVAEVAALMVLPLGVARVLIADMARMGLVTVHGGASRDSDAPDLALLERVLSGLRRL
jgi:Protein of unknown function (DUF742)